MRNVKGQLLALSCALAVALPAAAAGESLDEMPREAAAAEAYYESNPDLWATGPVQYLMVAAEVDAFEALDTTADRAAFIQWFWDRRDPETRDEINPVRAEFYARVAEANRRYSEFPRGWKSDRGLVHLVLGRPDAVRHAFGYRGDGKVWTYYTVGPRATEASFGSLAGEITIAFVKSDRRSGYQVYGGFGGPGALPLYVRDALNYARLAVIADPVLELRVGD